MYLSIQIPLSVTTSLLSSSKVSIDSFIHAQEDSKKNYFILFFGSEFW